MTQFAIRSSPFTVSQPAAPKSMPHGGRDRDAAADRVNAKLQDRKRRTVNSEP